MQVDLIWSCYRKVAAQKKKEKKEEKAKENFLNSQVNHGIPLLLCDVKPHPSRPSLITLENNLRLHVPRHLYSALRMANPGTQTWHVIQVYYVDSSNNQKQEEETFRKGSDFLRTS